MSSDPAGSSSSTADADPAAPSPKAHNVRPIPGAERIRALTDPTAIFKAFDGYPWRKDANFMAGLHAMLGDTSDFDAAAAAAINEMATHARIFYYAQRVGVTIDFAQYKAWLEQHPDHKRPVFLPEPAPLAPSSPSVSDKGKGKEKMVPGRGGDPIMGEACPPSPTSSKKLSSSSKKLPSSPTKSISSRPAEPPSVSAITDQPKDLTTIPSPKSLDKAKGEESKPSQPPSFSWQAAAPRSQLFIKRDDTQLSAADPNDPDSEQPNYPLRFAEMIRMLQQGIDIPGIRQVPDTIVRDPNSKPFGTRVTPKKPWEKEALADDADTTTPFDMLSLEFPPVDSVNP